MHAIENDLCNYIGSEVFRGGCFLFNMLVELPGQSESLACRILDGYQAFSNLLASWVEEARGLGILRAEVDSREVADFILTAINGAAVLYTASREPRILEETILQLRLHLDCLKCSLLCLPEEKGTIHDKGSSMGIGPLSLEVNEVGGYRIHF